MSDRPILATIETVSSGGIDTATVVLAYRDRTYSGSASGPASADNASDRLQIVAEAAAKAIEESVHGRWSVSIRAVGVGQVGEEPVCMAKVADLTKGDVVFGVAGIGRDDAEKAIARAVLDATNRRMAPKLDGE